MELETLYNIYIHFPKLLPTDSSFRSFYSSGDPPAVTELGQPVYVEVFVLKHEDEDLTLLLEDCWATPTENPHDPQRWNLLVKGWIKMKWKGVFYDYFFLTKASLYLCFDQLKLIFVSNPDVLSVVTATELSCCQWSPVRSWSIPLFISGLWSSCSHLLSLQHLKIWYVRIYIYFLMNRRYFLDVVIFVKIGCSPTGIFPLWNRDL